MKTKTAYLLISLLLLIIVAACAFYGIRQRRRNQASMQSARDALSKLEEKLDEAGIERGGQTIHIEITEQE